MVDLISRQICYGEIFNNNNNKKFRVFGEIIVYPLNKYKYILNISN